MSYSFRPTSHPIHKPSDTLATAAAAPGVTLALAIPPRLLGILFAALLLAAIELIITGIRGRPRR